MGGGWQWWWGGGGESKENRRRDAGLKEGTALLASIKEIVNILYKGLLYSIYT